MLSKKEREMIVEIWERIIPVAEDVGSDALLRPIRATKCVTWPLPSCTPTEGVNSIQNCLTRTRATVDMMFATYPGTKTYFNHWDISPHSPNLRSHGKKIVLAIAEGAKDISQLTVTLAPLQTYHAYQLRIDPTNFKLFSHCMLVALAVHLRDDFTEVHHAAMDKFLSAFAAVLAEKYR
ncbi:hemoglobin subunit alpha-2 isoform X1 [Cheilinus undulatus]|uniref:hemoglobin subunit alpha-2 isoform X1 n=1 Tax=Cheilinus undulatus TaxID=241271 RepID=UPI001BD445A9|nr:hemoglobin subunit alpha-2 isoform X1 [Cheilinus undulatus]